MRQAVEDPIGGLERDVQPCLQRIDAQRDARVLHDAVDDALHDRRSCWDVPPLFHPHSITFPADDNASEMPEKRRRLRLSGRRGNGPAVRIS
jgi:hypothetical protein